MENRLSKKKKKNISINIRQCSRDKIMSYQVIKQATNLSHFINLLSRLFVRKNLQDRNSCNVILCNKSYQVLQNRLRSSWLGSNLIIIWKKLGKALQDSEHTRKCCLIVGIYLYTLPKKPPAVLEYYVG